MSDDPEIEKLVAELQRLLPTAKVHQYSPLSPDAREHHCHTNAVRFAANNEGYRVVRGWLFFNYGLSAAVPFIRFTAHSLIESAKGERLEITPSKASQSYPFIEHPFGMEDFDRLIAGRHLSNIDVEV